MKMFKINLSFINLYCTCFIFIFANLLHLAINNEIPKECNSSYVLNKFTPNVQMNHLVIDHDLDYVYVGAKNRLYQLNKFLNETIAEVIVGPKKDNPNCVTTQGCNYTLTSTDNTNKLLLIDKGQNRIIACGSVFQGVCTTRSVYNISKLLTGVPIKISTSDVIATNFKESTVVGIVAEGPIFNNSVLYIASNKPPVVGEYYFSQSWKLTTLSLHYDKKENQLFKFAVDGNSLYGSKLLITNENAQQRHYKYIFETGDEDGYIFVVFSRTNNNIDLYRFIVARICKSDLFYFSYMELPIKCGNDDTILREILGAYYSPNDETLYVLFKSVDKSLVCSYTINKLNQQFFAIADLCFKKNGKENEKSVKSLGNTDCAGNNKPYVNSGTSLNSPILSTPPNFKLSYNQNYTLPHTKILCGAYYLPLYLTAMWPTTGKVVFERENIEFTALTIGTIDSLVIGFIGTSQGSILQVNFNNSFEFNVINEACGDRILSDFVWDFDKSTHIPHLYVPTSSSILRIRVAVCEKFTTCNECVFSKNPYCGWCILENRCAMKSECTSAMLDVTRWLGLNSSCPKIKPPAVIDMSQSPSDIELMIIQLPILDQKYENYRCIYSNNSVFIYMALYNRLNDTTATIQCSRPGSAMLPLPPFGSDNVNVTVSVQYVKTFTNHDRKNYSAVTEVVSTVITFYDCSVYGKTMEVNRPCAGCLASKWPCRWCVEEGKCVSSSFAKQECLSSFSLCPTVKTVFEAYKMIPVGIPRPIKLQTKNFPEGSSTPTCTVSWGSNKVTLSAELSPQRDYVTCYEKVYSYIENITEVPAFVTLHWKLTFVVDSGSKQNSTVLLYKCSVDRGDCSRCVTAESRYRCGWCSSDQCTIKSSCSDQEWITSGSKCPFPKIDYFEPTSGPLTGGTLISIYGSNMGTNVSEVESINVGVPCIIKPELYQVSIKLVCETQSVQKSSEGELSVSIKGKTATTPKQVFHYRNPVVSSFSPSKGPQGGGTMLTVVGENLDTGSNISLFLIGNRSSLKIPCIVENILTNTLVCRTDKSPFQEKNLTLNVRFDLFEVAAEGKFAYVANPMISEVKTISSFSSFLFGGKSINVEGNHFKVVQNHYISVILKNPSRKHHRRSKRNATNILELPVTVFNKPFNSSCDVQNNTHMICYTPEITVPTLSERRSNATVASTWEADVTFIMDGVVRKYNKTLVYYPNPRFEKWSKIESKFASQQITILAHNLNEVVSRREIFVYVGNKRCPVQPIEQTEYGDQVKCEVPEEKDAAEEQQFLVKVVIDHGNKTFDIGYLKYNVDTPTFTTMTYIGISLGVLIPLVIIVALITYFCKKSRQFKANKNDHQKQMENLEMSVRADFLRAFAELNVEMNDVTADIEDAGIPCLDYRTYVTNLFFPSCKYHPCMNAPAPDDVVGKNLEAGLSQFHLILSNQNFLSAFIHTLEEQKSFSNREKGNVASLLTVVLHNNLDYFTEIMKCLVSDLISQNIHRNPKLLLRRSDSVAERMLSNWMYICLYPYLRDKAGSPIFLLLKAIKQQVSKGAVDAVSGRARYTLSDDRLLQEDVDSKVLTLFVASDPNSDDEAVMVKVLSCDSIAQVKEKVMDAVYKKLPFSQRPKADQLDLEWRHGRSGHVVLPTEQYVNDPNSRWRRLMTIADYNMTDNATIVLIPKQIEYEGSQDLSSVISSHTNETNPLSPMLPDESSFKTYHLVKYTDDSEGKRESTINRDRQKHIPEIYLLRLISMKGTLQSYVDAALNAILDKSSIPPPVKHFFHFLDEKAAEHDIADPEILHIWKTNSLPGRFWVTILKNPDSVFDIEKPDTIASSMAVISQTLIDACSVTEHKPTKDSPINKQLYAKEIPNYKKLVRDYYKVIKEQQPVSEQDINAFIAQISREHRCEFDVSVALKELWGYLCTYYEAVNESLESLENDSRISTSVRTKLQQIYNLLDTA